MWSVESVVMLKKRLVSAKSPSISEESGLQPGAEHQTESDTQDQDPDLSDSSSLDVPVSTESHQSDGATSINTHTERLMPH